MMDALNFAYWLNGFAELSGDTPPTPEQWKAVREHLALVFNKVTPPVEFSQPRRQPIPATVRVADWFPYPVSTDCTTGTGLIQRDHCSVSTC